MESLSDPPLSPQAKGEAKYYDDTVKFATKDVFHDDDEDVPFSLKRSSSQVQFGLCSLSKIGWASLDTEQHNSHKDNPDDYLDDEGLIRYNWLLETCEEPMIEDC